MCIAIPGKIISISGDDPLLRTGTVDIAGIQREINLALIPEVKSGNWVLAHAGVAIGIIDDKEAAKTLAYLEKIAIAHDIGENTE